MSKHRTISLAIGFIFGWSLAAVFGVYSNADSTTDYRLPDVTNTAKKTNVHGYPFQSKSFYDLLYKVTRDEERSRNMRVFNNKEEFHQNWKDPDNSSSLSSETNDLFHDRGLQAGYTNTKSDPFLSQIIQKYRRAPQRRRREVRFVEAASMPEIKVTIRVRRRRSRALDFTQVNKDVCPPSLCRALDEHSRGGGWRPRGTGGTVFYQGDIVLDRDLDRVIYPSIAKPNAQRQRNSQRRVRDGNKLNSNDSSETRQRQNAEPRRPGPSRRRCRGKRRSRCHQTGSRGHTRSKGSGRRRRAKRSIDKSGYGHDENLTDIKEDQWSKNIHEVNNGQFHGLEDKGIGSDSSQMEGFAVAEDWRMQERSGRTRRATMRLRSRLWKNGVVVYRMEREIRPEAKRAIQRAIAHIQQRTCVRFREKKNSDTDYIRFISEPGCWSQIGRVGGSQMVSLGRGCESLGTAVHEIVHSLGVWHEQARPDRNRYVRILEENISERFRPDFEAVRRRLATDRGYPYDYQSLMHYGPYAFTRVGEPTIQVIGTGKTLNLRIGQRRGLSTIDISQLRDMYKCNQRQDIKETVCHKTWTKHLTSCYKFETSSPAQFDAAHLACSREKSNLVVIENSREQRFIDKVLGETFPRVMRWRTAGRSVNRTMVWYLGDKKFKNITSYKNWAGGHPGSRTSLVLYRDPRSGRVKWLGESTGDRSAPNHHRLPYICEKPARRKCVELRYRDGRDYRGHLDHTRDGYTCQRWTENYPHNHPLVNESRAAAAWMRAAARRNNTSTSTSNAQGQRFKDGIGSHNKCRNPSGLRRNRPWCYTTKRRHEWGYCDVSPCTSSLRQTGRGSSRQGRAGGTATRRGTTRDLKPNRRTARPAWSKQSESKTISSGRGTPRRRPSKRVSSQNGSKKQNTAKAGSKTQGTRKRGSKRQRTSQVKAKRQDTTRNRSVTKTALRRGSARKKTLG